MSEIAIGIDLGTTFTAAAVYRNGSPEIIPNLAGHRLTSSTVFYSPLDKSVIVGELAYESSLKYPKNYMQDIKRIIGRSNDDAYVNNFIKKEREGKRGLRIVKGRSGFPCIKIDTINKQVNHTVTAEDVSSEILKYMKDSAESFLDRQISEAVISVPANFSYSQREATKRAAEQIGFKVLRLITEPVAAAISYTYGKLEKEQLLIIVDLGGGTLDVSIIQSSKNKFIVKAVQGDMFLGGRDFDEVIIDYLLREIQMKYGTSPDPNTKNGDLFQHRIRKIAVTYKHALSTTKTKFSMPIYDYSSDTEFDIQLSRGDFEKLAQELFDRILYKVDECLSSAELSANDVDKVVLAGGSTRIPKLQELLTTKFDGKPLCKDFNPDEAVALGASIHAALLKEKIEQLEVYQLKDVAPHSLGILAKYDLMVMFIKKGTQLPVEVKQVMETSENDQESVIFSIYEGERKHCIRNRKLGDFLICKLPPGKAGQVEFEVTFILDDSGLLRVKASENQTKNCSQLEIRMNDLALCDSSMFENIQNESLINEEDRKYEEFYRFRLVIDTFCAGIIYDIDLPDYRMRKDTILKEVNRFQEICLNSSPTAIDALKSEFTKLQKKVNSLIKMRHSQ